MHSQQEARTARRHTKPQENRRAIPGSDTILRTHPLDNTGGVATRYRALTQSEGCDKNVEL